MKSIISCLLLIALASCQEKKSALPIVGTWRLLSGTLIENNDTTVTDYTKDKKFIKVINATHFTFLSHNTTPASDSTAFFSAGGGTYTLVDSIYTENLEFCSDRAWENNRFEFVVTLSNDTLVQTGVEKVAGTSINRLNIEKYVREETENHPH